MKILDIAFKDLTRSFRSMFAIGMMAAAPLMITGLIYFAFGGASSGTLNLPAVKVGILNLDALPANSAMPSSIGQTIHDMFHDDSVKSWITALDYTDEASARTAVNNQTIGMAVIIPPDFTNQLMNNKNVPPILIVQDPTLTVTPNIVHDMIQSVLDGVSGGGIVLRTITEREQANGVSPDPAQIPNLLQEYETWYVDFQRNLFHYPDRAALKVTTPSSEQSSAVNPMQSIMGAIMTGMMIFFAFYTGAYAMMSILHEEEEGTLARLFTTPTNQTFIMTGKFLAVFLTVTLQGLVLMIASHFAFGVHWGAPLNVALALTGQVVAASGLGVLLIAFMKNSRQAGPVLGGALTGLGMLGGLFTAMVPNMPAAFTMLANFTPQGWVMKAWSIALNHQPTSDLFIPFIVTVVMGLIMFAIGAALFRRRFA
jgi:ABC-2 type transport system permease protein